MLRRLLPAAALLAPLAAGQAPPPNPIPPASQQEVRTYTLPPDKLAQAIEFSRARNRLHFAGAAWGGLTLLGLLAWKVAPRFRKWAERASHRSILQAYIFAPLLLLALDILNLPVSLYGHHLQLEYEQSVQGWGSWFWDWTKGEFLSLALGGAMVWILYAAIRRSPRRWWFYFWVAAVPIVVLLLFITPVVIQPMFYRFEPLAQTQPHLVADMERVVARGGLTIPPDRMYEMKASAKLKSLNAYVAGVGATKRVVVWDTTLQKMTEGETLFVFGHEMGHYVLGHIWILIGATCASLLVFLFLGYHATGWALEKWGARWSIKGMADWASLPVLMMAMGLFGFVSEPLSNSFSRVLEHNADIYGLEVIHGIVPDAPQAAARAFQILGEVSLADPHPSRFIEFWLYSHPAVSERMRFAAEYDPWDKGQEPKYVR